MYDKIRLAVSLYDYSDRTKKGISVYVSWTMLLEKGGLDGIPDFEGGQGYVAGSAAPANGHTVDLDDEDDGQDDDQDDPTGDARMPESMMALPQRQRSKSAARKVAGRSARSGAWAPTHGRAAGGARGGAKG